MWAGYRSTRALRWLCACLVAVAAGRPLSVFSVLAAQHRTWYPYSALYACLSYTMKSLLALVVVVLTACAIAHSDKSTSEEPQKKNMTDEKKRNGDSPRDNYKNPMLNRVKTLVSDDGDKLRQGVNSDNLESTAKPKNRDMFGYISGDTFYMLAISAGITASIVLTVSLITYGCYILVERAKSAAAVDYPAYGVTGPTPDITVDRRLAQSAQMYHYQHQKQQIIAMERSHIEQRDCSLSGPESEEDNEEGDYTVYECPGFATTGDMEVKNPLFEETTPATPGKVQVLQAQPKE